jgi:hypothetical protein
MPANLKRKKHAETIGQQLGKAREKILFKSFSMMRAMRRERHVRLKSKEREIARKLPLLNN